jgi:hypothetical protein
MRREESCAILQYEVCKTFTSIDTIKKLKIIFLKVGWLRFGWRHNNKHQIYDFRQQTLLAV